ncbi:MAG: hypothetical protein WCQ82_08565 [Bacteroidaceae bacterium]
MRKNYYLSMIFLSMLGAAAPASTMAVNSEVNTVQMDKKRRVYPVGSSTLMAWPLLVQTLL